MSDRGKMQIKTDHLQSRDHQPWPQVPENIRVKKRPSQIGLVGLVLSWVKTCRIIYRESTGELLPAAY